MFASHGTSVKGNNNQLNGFPNIANRDAKLQSKRALAALGKSTKFKVEELASLRNRFIQAAQDGETAGNER